MGQRSMPFIVGGKSFLISNFQPLAHRASLSPPKTRRRLSAGGVGTQESLAAIQKLFGPPNMGGSVDTQQPGTPTRASEGGEAETGWPPRKIDAASSGDFADIVRL